MPPRHRSPGWGRRHAAPSPASPPGIRQRVVATQQEQPVRPRGIGLAATAVVAVPGHTTPDRNEHVVAELDQVEVVHRHSRLGQPAPHRGAERGRRVNRDHLDPTPPPPRLRGGPVGDRACITTVHDVDHLAGGQVDEGSHPRLDPPPGTCMVLEPTHTTEPVLIDPQVANQPQPGPTPLPERSCCLVDEALDRGPRHRELGGDPVDGADLAGDRVQDRVLQPLREPCAGRDLRGVLGERAPASRAVRRRPIAS